MADGKGVNLAPLLERLGQNPAALGLIGQLLSGGNASAAGAAVPAGAPVTDTEPHNDAEDTVQTATETEEESIPASGGSVLLPPPPGRDHGRGRREVLLALRPFLSSRRCASVDRLLRALELYEVIEESRR